MRPWMLVFLLAAGCEGVTGVAILAQGDEDMILIPAGEFLKGTPPEEAEELAQEYGVHVSLFQGECPQRRVKTEAFWIDRCPVTNAQYQKFVQATGHRPPTGWRGAQCPKGREQYPVTGVYWQDADAYADWAGKRLPTEAEWEKAARGVDGRRYPWGNEWEAVRCPHDDGSSPEMPDILPVGAHPETASPYGVLDMVGNVAQWTSTPSQPPNPQRKWAWYVVKGAAATHSEPYNFRCAARNFSAHTSRAHPWLGFRCARDAKSGDKPRELPEFSPPSVSNQPAHTPDEQQYLRRPILIHGREGSHSASLTVPWFPAATFGLNIPEQVTVAGFPFGWRAKHTPIHWTHNDQRTLAEYECEFEGKARLQVRLESDADSVKVAFTIGNLTGEPFRAPHTNTCLNLSGSRYFPNMERTRTFVWTDAGPTALVEMPIGKSGEPLHGGWSIAPANERAAPGTGMVRLPFIFAVSRDGEWVVSQAYATAVTVASNAHYTCLHTRPQWPDIPAGQSRTVEGRLYFLRGDAHTLHQRWRRDFDRQ